MATVKIVYASMGGRNKKIAYFLNEYFMQKGALVDVTKISETDTSELLSYDIDILVTYTYGQGEIPEETMSFFKDLKAMDLKGQIYGLAGSSSKKHQYFGRALDYFETAFQEAGGMSVSELVKIDERPDRSDFNRLRALADALLEA